MAKRSRSQGSLTLMTRPGGPGGSGVRLDPPTLMRTRVRRRQAAPDMIHGIGRRHCMFDARSC